MNEEKKTVTKFKKIDAYKTDIYVNERHVGSVEQDVSGAWVMKPAFPPLVEEEYLLY